MSLTVQDYVQIGYLVLTMIFSFAMINVARSWVRVKKEANDLHNFEISIGTTNSTDALKLLDQLIADTISDYVVLTQSSFSSQEYINSEKETELVKEIAEIVSNRLSPILLAKLSIYYTPEAISEVIGNKTYMQVTAYVVGNNTLKNKPEE